jgi:hypothetical protein
MGVFVLKYVNKKYSYLSIFFIFRNYYHLGRCIVNHRYTHQYQSHNRHILWLHHAIRP